jgi:hypothetical protein
MTRLLCGVVLLFCAVSFPLKSQDRNTTASRDYLFAWAGDAQQQGNDFLAVIDAAPSSAAYGKLVTTLATDGCNLGMQRIAQVKNERPAGTMIVGEKHPAGGHYIFGVMDLNRLSTRTSARRSRALARMDRFSFRRWVVESNASRGLAPTSQRRTWCIRLRVIGVGFPPLWGIT